MAYLVSLTARAQRDLVALYEHLHAGESAPALRWYQGLRQAILTLEEYPNRCPLLLRTSESGTCSLAPSLTSIV